MPQKKRATYTSKGERRSVAKSTVQLVSTQVSFADKALNRVAAWKKGKNPYITVQQADAPKDKQFRRVRMNDIYGNPKKRAFNAPGAQDE